MSGGREVQLAPSLLAAASTDLGAVVQQLSGLVDIFHVDVMDGHFVPNISMGPSVVSALREVTEARLDVHLMVADPDRWISRYRDAGADWISVHVEAATHLERTLSCIRDSGARAGLALNPATHPLGLEYVLEDSDLLLVMSVNPGFGGQSFLPHTFEKIAALRSALDAMGRSGVQIEVDGGVNEDNAAACVGAGAGILVAGSSVFGADDPVAAARAILVASATGSGNAP
ncbi:MAG: ribulose-phosphate 3-epimerase [Acidobacteriota bacterium]